MARRQKEGIGKGKVALLVAVVAAAFALGMFGKSVLPTKKEPKQDVVISPNADEAFAVSTSDKHEKALVSVTYLERSIQSASTLVSTTYRFKDADTYSNTKKLFDKDIPFTKDQVVYTYKGYVEIGVKDLSAVNFHVTEKEIEVQVPKVEIITPYIDPNSFEYYDVKNSIFNQTDMKDYTDLVATLEEKKKNEVLSDAAMMDEAQTHANNAIKTLIQGAAPDYDVRVVTQ